MQLIITGWGRIFLFWSSYLNKIIRVILVKINEKHVVPHTRTIDMYKNNNITPVDDMYH